MVALEIEVTPSPVTYFIAEPALKEITFAEDYELLKWLKDNAGEYLYSDEAKSVKAYWIDATGLGGYRVEDEDVLALS